ncbi:glycosyltransferase family 2 protein [Marivita sp. GX14005]|uniref:glycosyltransferase family 2 protein n=1 Tax=Marivita sp. GX14005 TaxID=2942276 RepID=UPI0020191A9B|nr:glycosyltransferase family 2 protein [Marivita sp. GX14005]MCL3881753.1 glycosyltransferase family 2 protein [Marivita sp. GX14005]
MVAPGEHQAIEPEPALPETRYLCPPDAVLVVVPALNEASFIAECLTSLRREDPFMETVQITVVDGGSDDGTQSIVTAMMRRDPYLALINNPARLQSAGINLAVETAEPQHRFLVRCDAHAIYPPGYVRRVAEALARHEGAASVTTVMDATGSLPFQKASAWVVDTKLGSGWSAHRAGTRSGWVDHGHHAGFRIKWFRKIGGYDPDFSHNEDAEYDRRLALAGGRVWLDASIRMQYVMRPTPLALARQYWRYGKGRARTILKHHMRPRLRQIVPVANLLGIAACMCLGLIWPWAWLWPALYLTALIVVSATAALRLGDWAGVWAGPALGIMHNAWGAGFVWQVLTHIRRS